MFALPVMDADTDWREEAALARLEPPDADSDEQAHALVDLVRGLFAAGCTEGAELQIAQARRLAPRSRAHCDALADLLRLQRERFAR